MADSSLQLYCWGSTSCGQLGLPSADSANTSAVSAETDSQESIPLPRLHTLTNIIQVAAGLEHTLFLTSKGKVFVCGNGEVGQLGILLPPGCIQVNTPVSLDYLKDYDIVQVAAGEQHSMAVTRYGELYSWGDNTFGQTGLADNLFGAGDSSVQQPGRVLGLRHSLVTQVSCGAHHTLALTADGCVYSWGLNTNGQLGLPQIASTEPIRTPCLITALHCLPVIQVCCGGQVSACLSHQGVVVTWGSNRHSQLAREVYQFKTPDSILGKRTWCSVPFIVPHLAKYPVPIVHLSVGTTHVAALDAQGKLWTWGATNSVPRTVMDLVGSRVTQVQSGRNHVLVVVDRKRLYSMGAGECGQLGVSELPPSGRVMVPREVMWARADDVTTTMGEVSENDMEVDEAPAAQKYVKQVFCGGDCSFLVSSNLHSDVIDHSVMNRPAAPIPGSVLACSQCVQKIHSRDGSTDGAASNPITTAPTPTPQSHSAVPLPVYSLQLSHILYVNDLSPSDDIHQGLFSYFETAIASVTCWNHSFVKKTTERNHRIDMYDAVQFMGRVGDMNRDTIKDVSLRGMQKVVRDLPVMLLTPECARVFVLVCMTPQFEDPTYYRTLHLPYANKLMLRTDDTIRVLLCNWLKDSLDVSVLHSMIDVFKAVVTYTLEESTRQQANVPAEMVNLLKLLTLLHEVNKQLEPRQRLPPEVFYVPEIYKKVELAEDFKSWLRCQQGTCQYYCDYTFLFNSQCKMIVLRVDALLQMNEAMMSISMPNLMMYGETLQQFISTMGYNYRAYLGLKVRRDRILADTLNAFSSFTEKDLKLPLKVQFEDEEAQDEGGVRKEFFLLLMREILNPKYGMFVEYPETNAVWFSENYFERKEMYGLIGMMCGMAIYNAVIINLPFPVALYKKLLREPMMLDDLAGIEPVMARSLRALLEYEAADLEEVMCLNFTLDRKVFDEVVNKELVKGGAAIAVTKENREEYVRLVVEYILVTSIQDSFEQFRGGFTKVCGSRVLSMFPPHELMELVIGNEKYDWTEFQKSTFYKGVYKPSHATIQMFWNVFMELSLEEKKKFLLFLTGCDRLPLLGMERFHMIIESTPDTSRLPVAHTCVHQLDLPVYLTRERLKFKLLQAIQHCEGFGLI